MGPREMSTPGCSWDSQDRVGWDSGLAPWSERHGHVSSQVSHPLLWISSCVPEQVVRSTYPPSGVAPLKYPGVRGGVPLTTTDNGGSCRGRRVLGDWVIKRSGSTLPATMPSQSV